MTHPTPDTPDAPLLAEWVVAPEPGAFAEHFPGHPIVPGACLLDAAVAGVEAASGQRVRAVTACKLLAPVAPGERLRLHAHLSQAQARFTLTRGDGVVASTGTLRLETSDATT
ncbi:MAG: 3-hydroxyacyl-ACP dehydratase [Pseudomonadota bacterium]|nr:3-hydroxyacyl-ACP dehydratase [Pseudomonadota bacterium]